jgi:hypothetical protein
VTNEEALMKRCQEQRDEIRLWKSLTAELVSRADGSVTIDFAKVGRKEVHMREPRGGCYVLDSES